MRFMFFVVSMCIAFSQSAVARPFAEMFPQFVDVMPAEAIAELEKLDFKQGDITVGGGIAKLALGTEYYFLDAKDAEYVLHDLWGNPPGQNMLGMVFPAWATPLHNDAWGATLFFEDIGFVSDEDAAGYDYDALLDQLKAETREGNKWRLENGYDAIELVGWAAEPTYDQSKRMLYWAREIKFDGALENTLNYNLRALGRKGVLVINFIADMSLLDDVNAAIPEMLDKVSFTTGNRYADFNPSVDKVAAIGIGGLIAGKVLAKGGFLVAALLFLKKFWFLALIPLIWLKNVIFKKDPKA